MGISRVVKAGNLEFGTGIPKICVPIVGTTKEEIIEAARTCVKEQPDLVEWRCDFYHNVNDYAAVQETMAALSEVLGEIPMLFTFRTAKEGGNKPILLEDYERLNTFVSVLEYPQMIDVEYLMEPERMTSLIETIKSNGKTVIASHHRFDTTPPSSDMMEILEAMETAGADILKLAVMPHRDADVKNLMLTINEATCGRIKQPIAAIAMGEIGAKSRVTGELFGSCLTFGMAGKSSAPGQMPIAELRKEMMAVHMLVENILF